MNRVNFQRAMRATPGATFRSTAARARITPGRLGQILRGQVQPRAQELERLARTLRVPVGTIAGENRE